MELLKAIAAISILISMTTSCCLLSIDRGYEPPKPDPNLRQMLQISEVPETILPMKEEFIAWKNHFSALHDCTLVLVTFEDFVEPEEPIDWSKVRVSADSRIPDYHYLQKFVGSYIIEGSPSAVFAFAGRVDFLYVSAPGIEKEYEIAESAQRGAALLWVDPNLEGAAYKVVYEILR